MVSTLTDNEKTVMLAKLMGWREFSPGVFLHPDIHKRFSFFSNLYDEEKMALAWLVLNWAMEKFPKAYPRIYSDEPPPTKKWGEIMAFWVLRWAEHIAKLPPEQAQRLWLDKVLELAIEAGMVEVEK